MASKSAVWIRVVVVIVVLVAAIYFVNDFVRPEAIVVKAFPGKAYDAVPGSVVVRAEYEMPLKTEAGGRVIQSTLDEGNTVKEGDFLMQIDPTDLKLEIERTDSDLQAARERLKIGSIAEPDLEGAKADLQNAQRQNKLGSISDSDLQKQERVVTQLQKKVDLENVNNKQAVDTLENELKTKQRELEKMHITAQFDGKVSEVIARKGDLISANSALATIISTSRTVEAKISEENFSGIKVGEAAHVRFLGYGNNIYDAEVVKVLPTADPETQRYIVHLNVKIEPALLVPGITGEANIIVNSRDANTIIPRRALFQSSVFVVKDGVVEQRHVQTGFISLNQVEILKGLEQGEAVIVEDLDRFHPGDHVRTKIVAQ